jgi:hypothetical protein
MNRLLDPPGIKVAVQRMACTACGAEANASCTCGVSYVPKSVRAAEAVKANPEKSTRALEAETGLNRETLRRARKQVTHHVSPESERVTGQDGKNYPRATKPQTQTEAQQPENLISRAHTALTPVVEFVRRMAPQERTRFRQQALERLADAVRGEPDTTFF